MARPAHPDKHDERLRSLLEQALSEEVLIPCPDMAHAKLMRSKFKEIIRAHREWETGQHLRFKGLRFRLRQTHELQSARPHYLADEKRHPYTLAMDRRSVLDEILSSVSTSSTSVPLTNKTTEARADEPDEWDYDPDEEEDSSDDYDKLAHLYRIPKEGSV
jgi:hypothetical protein